MAADVVFAATLPAPPGDSTNSFTRITRDIPGAPGFAWTIRRTIHPDAQPHSMINRLLPLACLSAVLLSGCAIHQNVKAVDTVGDTQVCVINNPAVRPSVMAAYLKVLGEKGYTVRQLPESAAITDCKVTSTYQANWRWDLAMYMHFAQFRVFIDGKEKGVATYDATHGGANMAKFIDADKKIAELINQLFPGGAGTHAVAPGTTVVQ